MPLEDDILALLTREPGLKGREVASRLRLESRLVNSTLANLKRRRATWQDNAYRWFLKPNVTDQLQAAQAPPDTQLAKLCRYYLHCLSLDESGVSLFAQSRYNQDYIELPVLPELDPEERPITSFAGVAELFQRLRRAASRQVPYLGYPVRLRHQRTERWEGYFVEPVFLFEFSDEALQPGREPLLTGELPILNHRVLRSLAMGDASHVMDETARLSEDLGFSEAEPPELEDLIRRLVEIRPDWDWKEEMDPYGLSLGPSLAEINEIGIFNRAIVLGCERSQFTKGLEQELVKLQAITEQTFRPTALGGWLRGDFATFQPPANQDSELLEPFPLNSEQREGIEKALTRPLTVITGPPGTGKSQVVSTILVNAAMRGLRVVFASKNNKAVDVVETRVNALGPRPILLRLGWGKYQTNLEQFLTALLASRATTEDSESYREAKQEYSKLTARIRDLLRSAQNVIELRNEVDAAEQKAEHLRKALGEERFKQFGSLDADHLRHLADLLSAAAKSASRDKQSFLARLLWFALRSSRLAALRNIADGARKNLESVGIHPPNIPMIDFNVPPWLNSAEELRICSEQVRLSSNYFRLLHLLSEADRLEDIWHESFRLKNECADKSMRVWEAWLRLTPSRLKEQDRRALGDFSAVLRHRIQADEQGQPSGGGVFARYFRLFPLVVSQLPCWAVTSLAARGRIPLEPGFFDLLVVDEASQCDIASLLPLLFRAKAVVIIGDPKQLRHISAISERRDRELLQQHGMAETHVNWMFSTNSVFDLASPLAASDDIINLRDHHRSHSDIIGFSNEYFYKEHPLRIATNYDRLRKLPSDGPAVRWIDVQGHVTRPGSSALNEAEAQAVVKELERMILGQGYRGSIGVVTPFRAQVNRIRDILHAHPQAGSFLGNGELLVDTVYRFQGDERDAILFSPVVADGISQGAVRWLRDTPNQFNVAITRARAALVVVGDLRAAMNTDIEHLSAFATYVERMSSDARRPVNPDGANYDGGPDYPTVAGPERVSDWERLFYAKLYEAGLRPIPQYDVEKFTLDFALMASNRQLDIEVDGERYHRDWTGELLRRDQLRNMRLIELGWDVMRFWVYELRENMPSCVQRVMSWVSYGTNLLNRT